MGKASPTATPDRVRQAARQIKQKTLSSSSLLPPSLSSPSSSSPSTQAPSTDTGPAMRSTAITTTSKTVITTATAAFSANTQKIPARRHTTPARPEIHDGRVVDYSETTSRAFKSQRDVDLQWRSKEGSSNSPQRKVSSNGSHRQTLVNSINLRGQRRISRTCPQAHLTPYSTTCQQSDSTANDSQKSGLTTESLEAAPASPSDVRVNKEYSGEEDELTVEMTEEEQERQRNIEKCMRWIDQLPAKFSGMHIVQERAPVMLD